MGADKYSSADILEKSMCAKGTAVLSVITATYNAELTLPNLIESLRKQSDKDFEWVVVDGESTDNTLNLIESASDLNPTVLCEKDFGIYDALNKGIALSKGKYYVVIGADDIFDFYAIESYKNTLESDGFLADMVAASVLVNGKLIKPRSGLGWLYGISGVASCHSVGLLIKKSLHLDIGFYSRKFPIAADQLFIKLAVNRGSRVIKGDFVAGVFSTNGLSGSDHLGMLTELFRVQMQTERFKSIQVLLFFIRVFKNLNKIFRQYSDVGK